MPTFVETLTSYVPSLIARRLAENPALVTKATGSSFQTAVLFADISGFTPLSEQLGNSGPAGVETLSNILNDYFGQLIDLVTVHGGDVVKFAGDGLLALWPCEDDELTAVTLQATQAALAIQSQLTSYQAEQLSQLFLKISIGAGEVTHAHLGGVNDRWEHIINGQPLFDVSHAEGEAQPGEIIIAPSAWNLIASRCTGIELASGNVRLEMVNSPQSVTAVLPPTLPDDAKDALYVYIPGAIKARLNAGQTGWLAELRRVTVIFVTLPELNHKTSLYRGQVIMQALQTTLYRFEGSVNKISLDDKGITFVGALGLPPLAHENDALLGVQAALAIYNTLNDLGIENAIGVTTGRAFCGTIGNNTRREYTMIGDVVNLAARLMQAAPTYANNSGNPILCDGATFEEAKSRIHFEELPPISVKGKQGLISIYRPLGEKRQAIHSEGVVTIVGREQERVVLGEALQQLMQGDSSQVIVIEGEAGIGKSQLVNNLKRQAEAMRVGTFVGSGNAIERAASYHGWRGVFGQMFDISIMTDPQAQQLHLRNLLEDEPDIWERVALLNPILPFNMPDNELTAQMTGQARADNTRDLLIKLLQDSVDRSAKLLILEDAHWLDSVSWELVLAVSRRVRPLFLVIALRPIADQLPEAYTQLLQADNVHHLQLEPLSEEDTLALIQHRLGTMHLPQPVADLILDKGSGNPFFSEELAFALRDAGHITIVNGVCHIAPQLDVDSLLLPDTVQGIVTSRIDRLLPAEQLTLKVASVIGRLFAFNTLRDIYPIADDRPRLQHYLSQLEQRALTVVESPEPELAYIFKHIITQEVAYNLLLYEQRRQLHAAVADWYEETYGLKDADEDAPQPSALILSLLVHHHHHAGNMDRERHYAVLAGHQAVLQFANAEAINYLSRALELTDVTDLETRFSLLMAREGVYSLLGMRNEQRNDLENLEDAAYELEDAGWQAAVYVRWANFTSATSEYPTAIAAAQSAIRLAEQAHNREVEAAGYLYWGRVLSSQGFHGEARPHLKKALLLAWDAGSRHLEADSLRELGFVSRGQGDSSDARDYYQQALMIRREIGDRRGEGECLNSLGNASRVQGDFATAVAYHEQALRIHREIGDRQGEGITLDDMASAWANQGDYATARKLAEQSLRIKREIGDRSGEGQTLNNLGNVANNQGEYIMAEAYYEAAMAIKREIGDRFGLGQVLNNLGVLALNQGRFAAAREYFEEVRALQEEIGNRIGMSWVYHNLGQLALYAGEFSQALAHVQAALTIHRDLNFRKGISVGLNLQGQVQISMANFEASKNGLLEGLYIVREIGYRKGEALILASLGLLHHQMGDDVLGYDYSQQSLLLTQALSHPTSQGYALTSLGHALVGLGRPSEAAAVYQQALILRRELGEDHLAMDSLAGLARVFFLQQNAAKALAHVETILNFAEANSLEGSQQPVRILMTCYDVLKRAEDGRSAAILQQVHQLLQKQAASITDDAMRQRFLQLVPLHQKIITIISEG